MKKLFFAFLFLSTIANAQYKIKGTLNPTEKYTWILLYKIEGARQVFIKNTTIKQELKTINGTSMPVGYFEFDLPADAKKGMYRVTYDMRNNKFADFLFNKENVSFTFNPKFPEETISFSESKENRLFQDYLTAISNEQKKTDSLQVAYIKTPEEKTKGLYASSLKRLKNIQTTFDKNSKGTLANSFIKATNRYNSPVISSNARDYYDALINHFFDNINFEDKDLYNSAFLVDRISDYVFYMNYSDDAKTQESLHKKSIAKSLSLIKNPIFKRDVIEFLITQFKAGKKVAMVDYLFPTYYDKLPAGIKNKEFKTKTLGDLKAEVGRIAPDFSWTENGKTQKLSTLNDGENYILVFWSTGCSHCLREIPVLYEKTKGLKNIKVVSFALERDDLDWNNFKTKLKGWHNAIGLNKWENKVARTYQINSTPTYIILNADKKIIAKPEHLKDVEEFIKLLK